MVSEVGSRRQARLVDARLGIVVDARDDLEDLLRACGQASADLFLLRDKTATEDQLRAAAEVIRRVADEVGALFVLILTCFILPGGSAANAGVQGREQLLPPRRARARPGGAAVGEAQQVEAVEGLDAAGTLGDGHQLGFVVDVSSRGGVGQQQMRPDQPRDLSPAAERDAHVREPPFGGAGALLELPGAAEVSPAPRDGEGDGAAGLEAGSVAQRDRGGERKVPRLQNAQQVNGHHGREHRPDGDRGREKHEQHGGASGCPGCLRRVAAHRVIVSVPLLARQGRAELPVPGGDRIGRVIRETDRFVAYQCTSPSAANRIEEIHQGRSGGHAS